MQQRCFHGPADTDRVLLTPPSPIPTKRIVRASWSFSFPYYFEIDLGTSDTLCYSLVAEVRVRLSFKGQV